MMAVSRRRFLKLSAAACGAGAVRPSWLVVPSRSGAIAVLVPDPDTPYARGATLGIEEARRSAGLLRRPVELRTISGPARLGSVDTGGGSLRTFVAGLRREGVVAVVAALTGGVQGDLEEEAAAEGLVVLDARARRPDGPDRGGVFRTGLPESAYARAVARVAGDPPVAKNPAGEADSAGEPALRAALWDEGLFRYGAEQLNERYSRRFEEGMTGRAWAAWMAVKAASEAALRSDGGGPRELRDILGGPRAAFDGHKGAPLSFSGPGGTLAQPLYVIGARGVTEVSWPMEDVKNGT